VIHANDWQTALVPVYVNTVEWARPLHGAATVYTIHNLSYQGVCDGDALFVPGLGREHYRPGEFEHFGSLNLSKAAIRHSGVLTTVSPAYAREIQTPEYGCGLDGAPRPER
jgi:starch synthase